MLPEAVAGERTGLAHQRAYDVTVVYARLALTPYPLHALNEMSLVVHLYVVCVQPHVNHHSYQARRHRVRSCCPP